jgi:hypothetical protein
VLCQDRGMQISGRDVTEKVISQIRALISAGIAAP